MDEIIIWDNIPGRFTRIAIGDFNNEGKDDAALLGSDGNVYYTLYFK